MATRLLLQRENFLDYCCSLPPASETGCYDILNNAVSHEKGGAPAATICIYKIEQLNVISSKNHVQSAAAQRKRSLRVWMQKRARWAVGDKETGLQRACDHKVKQRTPIIAKRSLHHDVHIKRHAVADDHHPGATLPQVLQMRNELCGGVDVALGVRPNSIEKDTFGISESADSGSVRFCSKAITKNNKGGRLTIC
jgi:hypothetical protein